MKNIIIVGPARSGKSTLSRMLVRKYHMSLVCMDDIVRGLSSYPDLKIDCYGHDEEASRNLTPFWERYFKSISKSIDYRENIRYVIEGVYIDFDALMPLIDFDKFEFIGLTYNHLTSDEMYQNIQKFDTKEDWTSWISEKRLRYMIQYSLKRNQYYKKMFQKYHIPSYDISNNREEVLKKIVDTLEEEI